MKPPNLRRREACDNCKYADLENYYYDEWRVRCTKYDYPTSGYSVCDDLEVEE